MPEMTITQKALLAISKAADSSERIPTEFWSSIPLPDVEGTTQGIKVFFGSSRKAPDGIPEPQSPSHIGRVTCPDIKLTWTRPTSEMFPVDPRDLAALRDERSLEQRVPILQRRAANMKRHAELLDRAIISRWFVVESQPSEETVRLAVEWEKILNELIAPQFNWLYRSEAALLREWIKRQRLR